MNLEDLRYSIDPSSSLFTTPIRTATTAVTSSSSPLKDQAELRELASIIQSVTGSHNNRHGDFLTHSNEEMSPMSSFPLTLTLPLSSSSSSSSSALFSSSSSSSTLPLSSDPSALLYEEKLFPPAYNSRAVLLAIKALQSRIKELEKTNTEVTAANQRIESTCREVLQKCETSLNTQRIQYEEEIKQVQAARQELHATVASLTEQNDALRQQLNNLESKCESQQQLIRTQQTELQTKAGSLQALEERLQSVQRMFNEANERANQVETKYNHLKVASQSTTTELEATIHHLSSECERLYNENKEIRLYAGTIVNANDQLRLDLSQAQQALQHRQHGQSPVVSSLVSSFSSSSASSSSSSVPPTETALGAHPTSLGIQASNSRQSMVDNKSLETQLLKEQLQPSSVEIESIGSNADKDEDENENEDDGDEDGDAQHSGKEIQPRPQTQTQTQSAVLQARKRHSIASNSSHLSQPSRGKRGRGSASVTDIPSYARPIGTVRSRSRSGNSTPQSSSAFQQFQFPSSSSSSLSLSASQNRTAPKRTRSASVGPGDRRGSSSQANRSRNGSNKLQVSVRLPHASVTVTGGNDAMGVSPSSSASTPVSVIHHGGRDQHPRRPSTAQSRRKNVPQERTVHSARISAETVRQMSKTGSFKLMKNQSNDAYTSDELSLPLPFTLGTVRKCLDVRPCFVVRCFVLFCLISLFITIQQKARESHSIPVNIQEILAKKPIYTGKANIKPVIKQGSFSSSLVFFGFGLDVY